MSSLISWYGREVERLRSELDRLFDDIFAWSPFGYSFEGGNWIPAIDLSETGKEIVVHAEIPGMDVKDMDISLNGRFITIKGERKQEETDTEENYHRVERRYGTFSRTFELPADVNFNDVKATYKNGVLELRLPKSEEQAIKKINVKAS